MQKLYLSSRIVGLCLLSGILLTFSSCFNYLDAVNGIQSTAISNAHMQHLQRQYNSNWEWKKLDSLSYMRMFQSQNTFERSLDRCQPIQIFEIIDGKIQALSANCYARTTFEGIQWNYAQQFNTIPFQSAIPIQELNFAEFPIPYDQSEHQIVIFWSNMFIQHFKSLLDIIQIKRASVNIVLFNVDDFYF